MTEIRCCPIDQWHGPHTDPWNRDRPQFSASWRRTLIDLDRELDLIEAVDVLLGLDLLPGDIRLDGWPRASANPPPPVSITFDSKYGPKRFQCDRYADWKQNVRAIGLTLQRLRLVDEGGCTRSGEQYVGFGALPPGDPIAVGAAMTVEEAAKVLSDHSIESPLSGRPVFTVEEVLSDPNKAAGAYRVAAKRLHPDLGGDPADFRRITEARDLLLAHGRP